MSPQYISFSAQKNYSATISGFGCLLDDHFLMCSGQRQETKTRVQLEEELDSAIMDLTPKYKRKAAVKLEKFPHYRSMHPSPTLSLCNRFKSIVEKYLTLLITGYLEEIYLCLFSFTFM